MQLPLFRKRSRRSRGQSLVEFALTLPLMLLLLMVALDFGRIYLGWINLQNMTRIAANYAANNPTAWSTGDVAAKNRYQKQILEDANATNCRLPTVAGTQTAPDPTFADGNGDGTSTGIGDTATVRLSCSFGVITPFISNIVGGTVSVGSSAVFPVKAGMTPPKDLVTPPPAPVAAFTGNGTINTTTISAAAPFDVVFRDTSGGSPTSWAWDFGGGLRVADGQGTSTIQDPLDVLFALPGHTYTVTLTATNVTGSSVATMTVITSVNVDFTWTPANPTAGTVVQFTDASTTGSPNATGTVGSGQRTGAGWTPTHTFAAGATYTITHTVTYATGPASQTKTITIGAAQCVVPRFANTKRNNAQNLWTSAGFTGTVTDGPSAPNGNYTITTQSIVAASSVPCNSSIVVNDH